MKIKKYKFCDLYDMASGIIFYKRTSWTRSPILVIWNGFQQLFLTRKSY